MSRGLASVLVGVETRRVASWVAGALFVLLPGAQAQDLVWAAGMGGSYDEEPFGLAVDGAGNVYTTGYFNQTMDFDPGPGTFNLTSAGLRDVFVSKLDSSGNLVWAAASGGTSADEGLSVAADGTGNVYTTGYFKGTVDFDPGPGTFNLTSAGYTAFVSKLDTSGNFVWATALGGTAAVGQGIAVDGAGNVYTTGYFNGTADFDPDPGTTFNLYGRDDIFVSKLDASGNFVWAVRMGGAGYDRPNGVTVDGAGNVYTTGYFVGPADFDPGPDTFNLTSDGSRDVFVSKLNSSGNLVWAVAMGGPSSLDTGRGIAVDGAGNVYTTGSFKYTADFDPGPGVFNLTAPSPVGIFVSKLDTGGGFAWAAAMGGRSDTYGQAVAVDGSGNPHTAGVFRGTVDLDPGPGVFSLASSGGSDVFVSRFAQPPADLTISMADGQTTAAPGGSLTYVILATNLGPLDTTNARVTDLFPPALSCTWTCVGVAGATCSAEGTVSGDIEDAVDLPVGSLVAYTATCSLDPSASGTLSNTATVSASNDPNTANNAAIDIDVITRPQADLGIAKDDGRAFAVPGESTTYIVTVTNLGPSDVTGAEVTDFYPSNLSCVWTCFGSPGVSCTAGPIAGHYLIDSVDLPAGGLANYVVACGIRSDATGVVVNRAEVSPPFGVTDPLSSNNSAIDVDALTPRADLAITKDDGQTTAVPGKQVTYTIVASNASGPSDAPASSVADTFPTSLLGCSWTCAAGDGATCSASGAGDIADLADLPVGTTATYTATCTIDPGTIGTLSNTATVSPAAGIADTDLTDNGASDVDTLTPEADLAITKDDGVTGALPGDSLTYTIEASNLGASDALVVMVDDLFPVELVDCEWTCAADPGASCTAGPVQGHIADPVDLSAGTKVTYTASCTVDPAANFEVIANTAAITAPAGVTDPDPLDNVATDEDCRPFFADRFESGDTSAWSVTVP